MSERLSQYLREDPKPGSLWSDDTYHVTYHPTDTYTIRELANVITEEEDSDCRLAIDYELRDESGHWITRKQVYERDESGEVVYAPTFSAFIANSPVVIADRSSSAWGTCWMLAATAPAGFQPEEQ